jgi:hypothetical protein
MTGLEQEFETTRSHAVRKDVMSPVKISALKERRT